MFDNLCAQFGDSAIHRMSMLFTISSQVLKTFEQEFKEDVAAKNAALDTIIELLGKSKKT